MAAVANAFAIVLQASEARQTPAAHRARASLLVLLARRRRWLAGVALLVIAWPLQVLALTFAPITIVQPTLASTQLVLLAVARYRLRERIGALELLGALAIVAGVAAVVGAAAVLAYALGRFRARGDLMLVLGAGLAYAWVDFVNKLLANDLSSAHWGLAAIWLIAVLVLGALAFLEETSALQRRPAVTVAPVIGAVQDPLPVLMALWAGAEVWSADPARIAALGCGLAAVTVGAVILGRSQAVARVSGE